MIVSFSQARTRAAQVLVLLMLSGGVAIPAVSIAQSRKMQIPPTVHASKVYYYNGDSRVDLALALDELFLEEPASKSAADASLVLGTQASAQDAEAHGGSFVQFPPKQDAAALGQAVGELKALGAGTRNVRAVLYANESTARTTNNKQTLTNQLVVKLRGGSIDALAKKYRATVAEKLDSSPDTYVLSVSSPDPLESLNVANSIYENEAVEFSSPLLKRKRFTRDLPDDPLRASQWHLDNPGTLPNAIQNIDINVEPAWEIATGAGVNIAIVDDGLQTNHADLAANARTDIDIDINGNDADPSPGADDFHGTACAGLSGAVGNNGVGVTGVAYQAGLVGVRLIAAATTDAQEATGLAHRTADSTVANRVSVSSNSWGPSDDGATLETWGASTRAAVANAISVGRGGLGTVFVWAAGNGRCALDNVNLDGYASSRYTIAVGASGADGLYSYYSEEGASMLVNAPSSYGTCAGGQIGGIVTVDRTGSTGYSSGDYTNTFGGTSASTPIVSGVIALMLQANPNLGWRDVQHILVDTARRNDPLGNGWVQNASGRWFNHAYGFGRINAGRAVQVAQSWTNKPAATSFASTPWTGNVSIPDATDSGWGTPLVRTAAVTTPADFFVEHVEVSLNIVHTYRGDLYIELVSPDGTVSTLMTDRGGDANENYSNWLFTSVAQWGERGNGNWLVRLTDTYPEDTGSIRNLTVTLHGHQTGSTEPPPPPEEEPPTAPGASRPVLHLKVTQPAVDPAGGPVLYRFTWQSNNGKGPIVRQPSYSTEDALSESADGVVFEAGDIWTATVTALTESLVEGGDHQSAQFRIEEDGSVTFQGWLVK